MTREEAITEHRKMWKWIAEQYENGSKENVGILKEIYTERRGLNIKNCCFLCEYVHNNVTDIFEEHNYYGMCGLCPLEWEKWSCTYINSQYWELSSICSEHSRGDITYEVFKEKAVKYATEIAELKERE